MLLLSWIVIPLLAISTGTRDLVRGSEDTGEAIGSIIIGLAFATMIRGMHLFFEDQQSEGEAFLAFLVNKR